jgi:hypothetical protein
MACIRWVKHGGVRLHGCERGCSCACRLGCYKFLYGKTVASRPKGRARTSVDAGLSREACCMTRRTCRSYCEVCRAAGGGAIYDKEMPN